MKVYYVKKYSAVVVDIDRIGARAALARKLWKEKKIFPDFKDLGPTDFLQLDINSAHVIFVEEEA